MTGKTERLLRQCPHGLDGLSQRVKNAIVNNISGRRHGHHGFHRGDDVGIISPQEIVAAWPFEFLGNLGKVSQLELQEWLKARGFEIELVNKRGIR